MATLGPYSTSNEYIKFKIYVTTNSQNTANNTSNVTVKVFFYRTNTGYTTYGSGTVYCKINGVEYSASVDSDDKITNSGIYLFTKTLNITHNDDGSKNLYVYAKISHNRFSQTTYQGTYTTLTTIPRKSTLSVANGTLGTSQTLTVTRKSTSFTHTITYTCGSASGTICTKSTSTSISFTPPITLSSQNTTGTSVSVTYTITTYTGSTSVGSNSYTVTCSIPASVKPSCTIAVSDPTGYASTYGGYIKGLSTMNVTVTATMSYGSAISSYSTTANGRTYTTSSFTTGVVASSGTLTITATVKDKRGRTGTASTTITALTYSTPTISKLTVGRCNSDGTANDQGEYVTVSFNATITSLNSKNTAAYSLAYKKTSESDYGSPIALSEYNNVYSVSGVSYIFAASSDSSYNVRISATDGFQTITATTLASTASTILHFREDGTGVGLGKLAELRNGADFGWEAKFNKPVYGKALGMDRLPGIPSGADLNDYIDPGCWAIHKNEYAAAIKCGGVTLGSNDTVPPAVAGRFEVWSGTGAGIGSEEWSYIRQRFIPYNSANPTWERDVTRSSDNVWRYYDWWKSTLTPTMSNRIYHKQKVLSSPNWIMSASHSFTLSEPVSKQMHGIVLVFSAYIDYKVCDYDFISYYVPKELVAAIPSTGHSFPLIRIECYDVAVKFLYIDDTRIWGDARNEGTGIGSSIDFRNNKFVLRYVFGV